MKKICFALCLFCVMVLSTSFVLAKKDVDVQARLLAMERPSTTEQSVKHQRDAEALAPINIWGKPPFKEHM